ncbi:TPA: hypothetical protein VJH99_001641 [Salmonella enterica subsp. enterica serovar 28:e,h:z6]|nr:hypothetical protein [Salmonella enterica subsp. enterica serovar 28:e,h:z6]
MMRVHILHDQMGTLMLRGAIADDYRDSVTSLQVTVVRWYIYREFSPDQGRQVQYPSSGTFY